MQQLLIICLIANVTEFGSSDSEAINSIFSSFTKKGLNLTFFFESGSVISYRGTSILGNIKSPNN